MMKNNILKKPASDLYKLKLKMKSNEKLDLQLDDSNDAANQKQSPLKAFCLKGNQLSGSILIGNYNYLTQLEVSENEMEVLDLSSLAQLETLKCSYNKLMELMLNGSNLASLIADSNCLQSIKISPIPSKLYHVNVSHNVFTELPKWLNECEMLEMLDVSHNELQKVTDFLLTSKTKKLRVLNLSYNNIRIIERLPERFEFLEKLYLQSNEIQLLTDNLFAITKQSLKELNLSCNKLQILPAVLEDGTAHNFSLERLFITSNNFDNRIFDILKFAKNLKTLYAGYNKITAITEEFLKELTDLEELMLSGNLLQHLPESICSLKQLQVLRVHSNLLLHTPPLSKLTCLKVLDLAHNHLDHLDLISVLPQKLKYLDLSCNTQLMVDERQVQVCRTQRKWSLVDVSGKNRLNLPTRKSDTNQKDKSAAIQHIHNPPWQLGFSETPGKCRKLLATQLRECRFCNDEALFGIFVSGPAHATAGSKLAQMMPKLLQQKRCNKDNSREYMKCTLLAAQQKLSDQPVVAALLCHISRESTRFKNMVRPQKVKRYILRVASIGNAGAYLVRRTSNVELVCPKNDLFPKLSQSSHTQEDLQVTQCVLGNEDEYLIICNQGIWSVLDIDRIAREIRKEENVILAAKRVQDIAQSFGSTENLSVIVVRLKNIGTDVDYLIKELKQTVRRKPPTLTTNSALLRNVCKRACCDHNINCRHRLDSPRQFGGTTNRGSDRSSPSGQSDQALTTVNHKPDNEHEYVLAHARVLEENTEMEMLDETDSVLSEEQFKCWEYMLEQNTQLLFDKELNTISKSFTKNRNHERKSTNRSPVERYDYKSNLLKSNAQKFISTSSPQLLYSEVKRPAIGQHNHSQQPYPQPISQQQQVSFLSKHFGSSRSFATAYNLFSDGKNRDSLASAVGYTKLGGGPNAAYFGSLQRLMPYNLEYDFAVTQERSFLDDDDDDLDEHETRMRKYWGVATTEL